MKRILLAATVAISFVTFIEASEAPVVSVVTNADGKIVKKVNRARLNQLMYQRNGGKIAKPGTKMGTITYVNAQQAAPVKWLEANASVFAQKCEFDIKVYKGEFVLPMPKVIGEASLFVVDDPSLPSILHAPESCWCMVTEAQNWWTLVLLLLITTSGISIFLRLNSVVMDKVKAGLLLLVSKNRRICFAGSGFIMLSMGNFRCF